MASKKHSSPFVITVRPASLYEEPLPGPSSYEESGNCENNRNDATNGIITETTFSQGAPALALVDIEESPNNTFERPNLTRTMTRPEDWDQTSPDTSDGSPSEVAGTRRSSTTFWNRVENPESLSQMQFMRITHCFWAVGAFLLNPPIGGLALYYSVLAMRALREQRLVEAEQWAKTAQGLAFMALIVSAIVIALSLALTR